MPELPPGQQDVGGKPYMLGPKGELVPLELVKKADLVRDGMVRELFAEGQRVAAELAAFKAKAFADVDALIDLLAEQYGTKIRGERGNLTLTTYDGRLKVLVQVADQIKFGPELQIAKALVDECIEEWSADSGSEIRAIVMNAFRVDKEGQVNRAALLGLRRLEIADERWTNAMKAIEASIQVEGTKRYVRLYHRPDPQAAWRPLSLDVATA